MLYVLSDFQAELPKFIFSGLQRTDVRLIDFSSKPKGLINKAKRRLEHYMPHTRLDLYLPKTLREVLDQVTPNDLVLLFNLTNLRDVTILRKHLRSRHISEFLWDPVLKHNGADTREEKRLAALFRLTHKVATFDPDDAKKYKLQLVPAPYRNLAASSTAASVDFYFLGQDKGRLDFLLDFKQAVTQHAMACHFHIVPDRNTHYTPEQLEQTQPHWIPYAENLTHIQQSRCLLEVVQHTQSGATLRSMEALFGNCKLITNRLAARQDPHFDPSRTYVLDGPVNPQALHDFLASPIQPASAAAMSPHEINTWVENFM